MAAESITAIAYDNPTLVAICLAVGYMIGAYMTKRKMRRGGMGMGMM